MNDYKPQAMRAWVNRDLSLLEKIKESVKLVLFAGFPVGLCLGEREKK